MLKWAEVEAFEKRVREAAGTSLAPWRLAEEIAAWAVGNPDYFVQVQTEEYDEVGLHRTIVVKGPDVFVSVTRTRYGVTIDSVSGNIRVGAARAASFSGTWQSWMESEGGECEGEEVEVEG